MVFFTLIWISVCFVFVGSVTKLSDLVPVCNLNDVKVDNCLETSTQMMLPTVAKGVEDWSLVGLDPVFVPSIPLGHNNGPINIKMEFINTTVTGFSKINITGASVHKIGDTYKFSFNATTNGFGMIGGYQGKGKILFFPLKNEGHQEIHMGPSDLNVQFECKPKKSNGREYLEIEKFKLNFGFSKDVKFALQSGNNGKPTQLDKILNKLLADNILIITEEMKPTCETAFGDLMKDYIQDFFHKIPIVELFEQ